MLWLDLINLALVAYCYWFVLGKVADVRDEVTGVTWQIDNLYEHEQELRYRVLDLAKDLAETKKEVAILRRRIEELEDCREGRIDVCC